MLVTVLLGKIMFEWKSLPFIYSFLYFIPVQVWSSKRQQFSPRNKPFRFESLLHINLLGNKLTLSIEFIWSSCVAINVTNQSARIQSTRIDIKALPLDDAGNRRTTFRACKKSGNFLVVHIIKNKQLNISQGKKHTGWNESAIKVCWCSFNFFLFKFCFNFFSKCLWSTAFCRILNCWMQYRISYSVLHSTVK